MKRQITSKTSTQKKVRTGCVTCKRRRVKCDEKKPYCQRCISAGRQCDGYSVISPRARISTIIQNISMVLPGNKDERDAFHYFQACIVPELVGYFSEDFWERTVLQVGFSEPSLRHAVIAAGSLHRYFHEVGGPDASELTDARSVFALRHYIKAISHLRPYLSWDRAHQEITLMTCIMFVCYEIMRADYEAALTHLRSAMRIADDKPQYARMRRIITRIALQGFMFLDPRSEIPPLLPDAIFQSEKHCPTVFKNINEARDLLNIFFERLLFLYCSGHLMSRPETHDIYYAKVSSTIRNGVAFLTSWTSAFDDLLDEKQHELKGRELRGAILLKIHQIAGEIQLATYTPTYASRSEEFSPKFNDIIRLSRILIKADATEPLPLFATDLGVGGPLYFCIHKAQDIAIRRQAQNLLCERLQQESRGVVTWPVMDRAKAVEKKALILEGLRLMFSDNNSCSGGLVDDSAKEA